MGTWPLKLEKIAGGGDEVERLSHCEKGTPRRKKTEQFKVVFSLLHQMICLLEDPGPDMYWFGFFAETKAFVLNHFCCILVGRRREKLGCVSFCRDSQLLHNVPGAEWEQRSSDCSVSPVTTPPESPTREQPTCSSEACSSLHHLTVYYIIAAGCSPDKTWLLANQLSFFLSPIFFKASL